MEREKKPTVKDIVLTLLFIGIVFLNIYFHIRQAGFQDMANLIEQTILIMLSFVGLVELSSNIGWNIFVPNFYKRNQQQKSMENIRLCMDKYFEEDTNFLRDYSDDRIGFIISQLGINKDQFDQIRIELIKMRCIPLKNMEDAREKIRHLVKSDYPAVINQRKMDSSKICYHKVDYFINMTDLMFMSNYSRELPTILTFLIHEKKKTLSFDKIIIPHDSNFLLGVETGKQLGKPVVKMRHDKGKIETEKRWDGNLKENDRVIIVHDVLVTADQILETIDFLPKTCQIIGFYCLIVRKEWDGKKKILEKRIPVHQVMELDDKDIRALRGESQV